RLHTFSIYLHPLLYFLFFSLTHPSTPQIYTLSLHDALPISRSSSTRSSMPCRARCPACSNSAAYARLGPAWTRRSAADNRPISRSEEHTSELQSRFDLVCRLLLEKKKKKKKKIKKKNNKNN